MNEEMRETFEQELRKLWSKRNDPFLRPCNDPYPESTYQDPDAEFAWVIWQAAYQSRPAVVGDGETIEEWPSIETAPKDGTRIRLLHNNIEYHGWYEENLQSFMSMDSEWNLIKLNPTHWAKLESSERARCKLET